MNKNFIQKYKKYLIPGLAVFGLLLSLFLYELYYLNHAAKNKCVNPTFIIVKGEGTRVIVEKLHESCIISAKLPFLAYLKVSGLAGSIQAGEYDLSQNLTPLQVADILTKGKVTSRKITIPEGWTIDAIGTYLEKENIVSKTDFEKATKNKYDYEFLKDKPDNIDLEGFLFPDTYQISQTVTAEEIVKLMLNNFDSRLETSLRADIAKSGMSTYEAITLASIVEREVAKAEDRKIVASVFLNRLEIGIPLESCATIQYILKSNKQRFTYTETRVSSPYNTYIATGLPVGPIGNPGAGSIRAVLYPDSTDYLYFVSADGETYFSKTLDEHEGNVARYLN